MAKTVDLHGMAPVKTSDWCAVVEDDVLLATEPGAAVVIPRLLDKLAATSPADTEWRYAPVGSGHVILVQRRGLRALGLASVSRSKTEAMRHG